MKPSDIISREEAAKRAFKLHQEQLEKEKAEERRVLSMKLKSELDQLRKAATSLGAKLDESYIVYDFPRMTDEQVKQHQDLIVLTQKKIAEARVQRLQEYKQLSSSLEEQYKKFERLIEKNENLHKEWLNWSAKTAGEQKRKKAELEIYSYRLTKLREFFLNLAGVLDELGIHPEEQDKAIAYMNRKPAILLLLARINRNLDKEAKKSSADTDLQEEQQYLLRIRKEAISQVESHLSKKH